MNGCVSRPLEPYKQWNETCKASRRLIAQIHMDDRPEARAEVALSTMSYHSIKIMILREVFRGVGCKH